MEKKEKKSTLYVHVHLFHMLNGVSVTDVKYVYSSCLSSLPCFCIRLVFFYVSINLYLVLCFLPPSLQVDSKVVQKNFSRSTRTKFVYIFHFSYSWYNLYDVFRPCYMYLSIIFIENCQQLII